MILLTVGTQLPFDRLTSAVDKWIAATSSKVEVVGQIGPSDYSPKRFQSQTFFEPDELDALASSAELIISHAGMGSIITALTKGKPIIVVPRLAELGEHRNDHQLATAKKFEGHPFVRVVFDIDKVGVAIDELLQLKKMAKLSEYAPDAMISNLRAIIGN